MIQNVNIGVAYPCLKYGVFIKTRSDAIRICIQLLSAPAYKKSPFCPLLSRGRVSRRCSIFA